MSVLVGDLKELGSVTSNVGNGSDHMNVDQGMSLSARSTRPRGTEGTGQVHSDVLATLRRAVRPYLSDQLPEWDYFAASTQYFTVAPRSEIVASDRDVFLLVRGMLKVVRGADAEGPRRVFEFVEAPALAAPEFSLGGPGRCRLCCPIIAGNSLVGVCPGATWWP